MPESNEREYQVVYEINVSSHFDGAHRLYDYDGKCARVHGHSWKVDVRLMSDSLNEQGMVCDFHDLKKILHDVVDDYDHILINDVEPFKKLSPTAENLSRVIYERLVTELENAGLTTLLAQVTVHESGNASATYYENQRADR